MSADRLPLAEETPRTSSHGVDLSILRLADRSCCCTAGPAVVAIIPASANRAHQTELLLCMHHYRECRAGLIKAGATVLDRDGAVVLDETEQALAADGA